MKKNATQPKKYDFSHFLLGLMLLLALSATGYLFVQHTAGNDPQQWEQYHSQQQLIQQIQVQAQQAMQGETAAFTALRQTRNQLVQPANPAATTTSQWLTLRTEIDQILLAQAAIQSSTKNDTAVSFSIQKIQQLASELAQQIAQSFSNSTYITQAIQQLSLAQQIDPIQSVPNATQLQNQIKQYNQLRALYQTLSQGKPNQPAIKNPKTQQILAALQPFLDDLNQQFKHLSEDLPAILRAHQAYQALANTLQTLSTAAPTQQRLPVLLPGYTNQQILYALATTSAILLCLWMLSSSRRIRQYAVYSQYQQHQNHQLQATLQQVAAGDLSMLHHTPTVAEQVVHNVQQLVTAAQKSTLHTTTCLHETHASTLQLQEAAEHQQDQTEQALTKNQHLAQQLQEYTTKTQQAHTQAKALQHQLEQLHTSTDTAHALQQPNQTTVEQLQQASTTTQQIQDQMHLIAELADQSNILALNTAMQAALAGEAGRAFTVVGNEVQRLAQQASDSTRQISGLLNQVQHHHQTSQEQLQQQTTAINAQNQTIAQNVQQLQQTQADSTQLNQDLMQLTQGATQHAKAAELITDHLHIIQNINQQTTEGATQTTAALTNLNQQIEPLQNLLAHYQPAEQPAEQPALLKT